MNLFETIRNWFINGETVTVNASTKADTVEFDWNLESGTFESLESKVIRLREEGKTQEQIAKETGKTVNQIKGILYSLLGEEKISRKKKYTTRVTAIKKDMEQSKKNQEKFIESRKNSKIVQKGLSGTNTVIDYSVSPVTIKMDSIDWVKKYHVNVKKFKQYYPTHTCAETEKEFNLPLRASSKVAKQLGISKNKFHTKKKVTVK